MRIECTQCDWLKNGMDCSKGRNVNHAGYCKFKHPAFDINKIGNMIHVSKEDYDEIKEAILRCAEKCQDEVCVKLNGIDFIIDIQSVDRTYKTEKTGVTHLGCEESYQVPIINSIHSAFRGAFNKDGDEVETDFMEHKIAVI